MADDPMTPTADLLEAIGMLDERIATLEAARQEHYEIITLMTDNLVTAHREIKRLDDELRFVTRREQQRLGTDFIDRLAKRAEADYAKVANGSDDNERTLEMLARRRG
jgi:lipopolysaccharide biosynthesis regulator YciM